MKSNRIVFILFVTCVSVIYLFSPAWASNEPYFRYCNVMGINTPTGMVTGLAAQVFDPNGTVPSSIAALTVNGPGGPVYDFTAADYNASSNEYWRELAGTPVNGEYTFTVTDSEGKTATTYCYLEVGTAMGQPNSSSLQASGDALTPALSWGAVSNYEENLFYRARIYNISGDAIWTSGVTTYTSVNVPPGTLSAGVQYEWQVQAFNDYYFYNSDNAAVSQSVSLTIDSDTPFFTYATVYKLLEPGPGGTSTILQIRVADPNGTLPSSISSLTVTGPSGFSETLGSADYKAGANEYSRKISGAPAAGIYAFTITDSEGRTATSYDYLETVNVPLVDASTLQASGDALAPRLSWSAPPHVVRSLYFQALGYDDTGKSIGASVRSPETAVQLSSGVLQPGVSYQWQVRAGDGRIVHLNARSITDRIDLTIDNSRPNFTYATVYSRHQPDGFFTAVAVDLVDPDGSVPGTITSLRVTGPGGGFVYDFKPQNYNAGTNTYFHIAPGKPQAGLYTFTATDSDGNSAVTHDYLGQIKDIPSFDETTVKVHGPSLTPTVSWGAISGYQGRPYYRLIVADVENNNAWVYSTGREPHTAQTIPDGILERGKSYVVMVLAFDHTNWVLYDNRSNTDWLDYSTRLPLTWLNIIFDK